VEYVEEKLDIAMHLVKSLIDLFTNMNAGGRQIPIPLQFLTLIMEKKEKVYPR
jgi:hypothetical protein